MDRLPLNRETQAAIRHALSACRHLAERPGRAVQSLWMAANQLASAIDTLPVDQVAAACRAVAALRECADLLVQHEAFFTGRTRKILPAAPLRLQEAM
ncbi:MAG TPA: hypothetical protein VN229_04455 [Terriglobales bacterium]|nr:hypothetical protein [Terriglobales bacterium]